MSPRNQKWIIRAEGKKPKLSDLYGDYNTYFTSLEVFHGGNFSLTHNGREYLRHKITVVDFVKVHKLSYELLSEIMNFLNYNGKAHFYRVEETLGLDLGIMNLESKSDFETFFDFLFPTNCNSVHRIYVEVGRKSLITTFPTSLKKAKPEVMEKLLFDFVFENPNATINDAKEYVFKKYGVWITPYYLKPGLDGVRKKIIAINGDD